MGFKNTKRKIPIILISYWNRGKRSRPDPHDCCRNRKDGKLRAIIVKFTCWYARNKTYSTKKKLKRKKILITENLTYQRYNLLNEAQEKYGVNNVLNSNGRILFTQKTEFWFTKADNFSIVLLNMAKLCVVNKSASIPRKFVLRLFSNLSNLIFL